MREVADERLAVRANVGGADLPSSDPSFTMPPILVAVEVRFDFSREDIPLEGGGAMTVRSLNAWANHNGRTAVSSVSITGDETPEEQELLRTMVSAEAQKYLLS